MRTLILLVVGFLVSLTNLPVVKAQWQEVKLDTLFLIHDGDAAESNSLERLPLLPEVTLVNFESSRREATTTNLSNAASSSCNCGTGDSCCGGDCIGNWHDNSLIYFVGDGWGNKGDDNDSNNFGFRLGFNTAIHLIGDDIRGQFGASYAGYDLNGRDDVKENGQESHVFVTTGVYKRSNVLCCDRLSWGIVGDYLHADNWGQRGEDGIDLAQIRGQIGYALNECNEIGLWGTGRVHTDRSRFLAGGTSPLNTITQVNLFWHHNWEYGADTSVYVGGAEEIGSVVVGLSGQAPLSRHLAMFGNVHYIIPSTSAGDVDPNGVDNSFAEETWNVTFGIVFYPGCKARNRTVSGHRGLPLIPVADNGTFAVETATGNL